MEVELAPEAAVVGLSAVGITIVDEGVGEGNGEIGLVEAGPAVGDAEAHDERVAHDAEARPEDFAVVVVDAVEQVHHQALGAAFREGVLVDAHPLRGGKPRADAAVGERDFVIAGLRVLRVVAEALAVAGIRIFFRTGRQLQRAGLGHDQDVAQVGVARAAEMGMAEADDGVVLILVAGAVIVGTGLVLAVDVVRDGIRVG